MKSRLWIKYAIAYFSIVVMFYLVNNIIGTLHTNKAILEENRKTLYRELCVISEEYSKLYLQQEISRDEFIRQLKVVDSMLDCEIWIVSADGVVLENVESGRSVSTENHVKLTESYPNFLEETYLTEVSIPGLTEEPMLCVIEPIMDGVTVKGYLVGAYPMSKITATAKFIIRCVNVVAAAILAIVSILYIWVSTYHIVNLRRLQKAATEYADGNFEYEMNIQGHDEFRDLGNSITYLAEQHSNLVDYQKNFIANISHDFRSPLTSIKGYAEAMKDGTIPYEIQGKYLNIILFETDRLSNLTNDLLDLSNFENKGVHLEWAPFDVVKMVKQSVMTFEGKCSQKNIRIRLVFATGEMYALADRGKIQQVLHNLIDNAIKFSNQDGTITVTVSERGDKIFVSVKDQGIGIPKESLNKVWERFYKTDLSRGKDKKGTGLGLSITKQIITAHNENITVSSVEGQGTEFVFSLAKAEKTE